MNRKDPKLTAFQFNQYINDQDTKGLSGLMSKDMKSDFPRCDWHWQFVCSKCSRSMIYRIPPVLIIEAKKL